MPDAAFHLQEFSAFIATEASTELVVDRSVQGELLRINFNISFPQLSCEFATLDVSDALGTVRRSPCMSRFTLLKMFTASTR
jgi:Endoplasmic Reticulum-Golgi Intermediate Compartment (ERGIC)